MKRIFFPFFCLALLIFSLPAEDLPRLTQISGPTSIAGASLWFFAIPDGSPASSAVVSAERSGDLMVGRMDLLHPEKPVDWSLAVRGSSLKARVTDHWHLFAHGFHWIAYSTQKGSFLIRLNPKLEMEVDEPIRITTTPPTNDLFMVEEPSGIAIGHYLPGKGHRIFRFTKTGGFLEVIQFCGETYTHSNGASAEMHNMGFRIFAPKTLNPSSPSPILSIFADRLWKPEQIDTLIDEPGANLAMPTSVKLPSGHRLLHARVRPAQKSIPGYSGDNGDIVRYILDISGRILSRTPLVRGSGNRPHTSLFDDLIVTTWDGNGSLWMRVDRIAGPLEMRLSKPELKP